MEHYWTLFKNRTSNSSAGNGFPGHNGNCTTDAWESSTSDMFGSDGRAAECFTYPNHSAGSFSPDGGGGACAFHQPGIAGNDSLVPAADPHLTCLKLGKRQYFEVSAVPTVAKKAKAAWCGGSPAPLCQVEGCGSALANAKDYHRRHKVCEIHAKAPRVVLLGIDQRFCQQCSRFHAVGEFDESKRSCRRRLAGHNQRRRKSSQEHYPSQARLHAPPLNSAGGERALSLLSSLSTFSTVAANRHHSVWHPSDGDLPARCRTALRELIAENRASSLTHRHPMTNSSNLLGHFSNSYRNGGSVRGGPMQGVGGHVTLDLMQDPGSAFGLLPEHDRAPASRVGNNNEGDCSELWNVHHWAIN